MNYSEVLEKYLYRIARDELADIPSVLPLLRKSVVFVPAKNADSSTLGPVGMQMPVLKKNGFDVIPVFLDNNRECLFGDSDEYGFVEIPGDSLLQALPDSCGIVIAPMTSLEVVFSPEMIDEVRSLTDSKRSEPAGKSKIQKNDSSESDESSSDISVSEPAPSSQSDSSRSSGGFGSGMNFDFFDSGSESESEADFSALMTPATDEDDDERIRLVPGGKKKKSSVGDKKNISGNIEHQLFDLIQGFDSIHEAYSLPHSTSSSEWVLGILADPWSSDDRFRLIESVALLSQKIYGYAGAVEVYDDLSDTHSSSWDLFKMIPPFYTKDTAVSESSLSGEIEKSDDSTQSGIKKSVSRLTRSGFRLFAR